MTCLNMCVLLRHSAIFTLIQCSVLCAQSTPENETDDRDINSRSLGTNAIAAWRQLVGCWSGVVTVEGVPGIRTGQSGYFHCCYGSVRMVETRVSFFTANDIPSMDRHFHIQLNWHMGEDVMLTLQDVISFGISTVHFSRRKDAENSSFSLEFRPTARSRVAFECHNLYVQDGGERLLMRSVVYYPSVENTSRSLYACPHFDGNLVAADTFPVPVRCRFVGTGLGSRLGCKLLRNKSNVLGLNEEAVTFVEYELTRSDRELCRDVNLTSGLGSNSDDSSNGDDSSSGKTLSLGALMAIVLVSVSVLLATLPVLRRYCCRVRCTDMNSSEAVAEFPHTIGARCSEDVTCEMEVSSGGEFQGNITQLFAIGRMEHWFVRPEDITELELKTSGGFGAVFRGMMHRSSEVAVKTIKEVGGIHDSQLIALQHETRMLRRIRHPNIVLFQGVTAFQYEGSNHLALVLEWVQGGHLGAYLKRLHDENWQGDFTHLEVRMMVDVSRGLLYLHHQSPVIVHRDLKPENVLVEDVTPPRAKITDFGLSALFTGESLNGKVGTRAYMAPEVVLRQSYGTSADMYSFGCIIWFVLAGTTPPTRNVKDEVLVLREKTFNNATLLELCIACVDEDPGARPQAGDAHSFLVGGEATMLSCELSESHVRSQLQQSL